MKGVRARGSNPGTSNRGKRGAREIRLLRFNRTQRHSKRAPAPVTASQGGGRGWSGSGRDLNYTDFLETSVEVVAGTLSGRDSGDR